MKHRIRNLSVILVFGIMFIPELHAQWIRTSLPDSGVVPYHLAVLGTKIFAGTEYGGLYYSTDHGSTWESPDSSYLDSGRVWFLSVVGTHLFTEVGNFGNFISSADSGRSWEISNIVFPNDWFGVETHGSQWFTVVSNSIFVSNDSGKSWNPFSSYFYNMPLTVVSLAFNDTETFVGTTNGIYASTDRGQTWQISSPNLPIYNVESLCILDSTILASTQSNGVYRADLYRQSWVKSDSGLTNPMTLQIMKVGNDVVLTAYNQYPYTGDVFFSTDAGTTWKDISIELVDTGISCMAASDSELYVGTYGGTIYKRLLSDLLTDVRSIPPGTPLTFSLAQNYPNPFNPSTVISYQLPVNSVVSLKVYDVLGREVKALVNERQNAGNHSATFNASNLSSGVYFYRLQAGTYSQTKKLLLLK
jgi:photosystem II stability/assembly factor-like uncharacterized protein